MNPFVTVRLSQQVSPFSRPNFDRPGPRVKEYRSYNLSPPLAPRPSLPALPPSIPPSLSLSRSLALAFSPSLPPSLPPSFFLSLVLSFSLSVSLSLCLSVFVCRFNPGIRIESRNSATVRRISISSVPSAFHPNT